MIIIVQRKINKSYLIFNAFDRIINFVKFFYLNQLKEKKIEILSFFFYKSTASLLPYFSNLT